ncbi:MAG: D-alanyl-D-alanine carboxypeptidase family protein [Acidimicrobiales bacterium]
MLGLPPMPRHGGARAKLPAGAIALTAAAVGALLGSLGPVRPAAAHAQEVAGKQGRPRVAAQAGAHQGGAHQGTAHQAKPPTAPPAKAVLPESRAYVLVDVNTGNVIAGYHERLRVPPASLTKVLTALVAVSYLRPDARVPGTSQSVKVYPNRVGIEKGVAWPLGEVLQSLLVLSANDAAYAIAQRISGSLRGFGAVMDRAGSGIGMSDHPVFRDPAGLDGTEGVGGGNLVSARDLAIAGRNLLHVPELAKIVREKSYDFVDPTGAPHDLPSMNYQFLADYPGAIGIKTGLTDRAGYCVMEAATRRGRTLLAVVMNGYNSTQTAIDLLNEGFATPVPAEPEVDRLPPVALPARPGVAISPARAGANSPARAGAKRGSEGRNSGGTSRRHTALAAPGTEVNGRSQAAVGSYPGGGATPGGPTPGGPTPGGHRVVATSSHRRTSEGGLGRVVGSWPGQLLLLLSALGALLALRELVYTSRARRRSPQPPAYGPKTATIASFPGSRRRREQLVDSYRRHERPGSYGGASPYPGRR